MELIERSPTSVDIRASEREWVALSNALGLALIRCEEQDLEILSGGFRSDLKELHVALSQIVPSGTGGFAEPGGASISVEQKPFIAVLLRVNGEQAVVRLGNSAALALSNALTITRGWLAPGDATTLLLCDDTDLLTLLREIRTIATHPRRASGS